MNRREFSAWVGRGLTAIGLGSLVAEAPAPAASVAATRLPPVRSETVVRRVHWVSLDRRHIEATLMGDFPGGAVLRVEMRPPVVLKNGSVVRSTQMITNVPHHEPTQTNDHWQANSWHEIEFVEGRAAKPYAEWWYKRPPEDSDAVTPKPDRFCIQREGDQPALWQIRRERDGRASWQYEDEREDHGYAPRRIVNESERRRTSEGPLR